MSGTKELIRISDMSISDITETALEKGFKSLIIQKKDTFESIIGSMLTADEAWLKYTNDEYEPIEDIAKKDRATLNKADKNIAERYAEFKAAYEEPLQVVEANVKSIRNAIKEASGTIDKSVKDFEGKEKEKKKIEIEIYFKSKEFNLVSLEKIFNYKWLNKTCKMFEIKKEIDDSISLIYNNIKILESLGEYGIVAKAFYLDTLDIGAAMRKVEVLKENSERLAREKIEREERELKEQVKSNEKEEQHEIRAERKFEEFKADQKKFYESLGMESEPIEEKPEILEYTLRFKGTKEQLFKLRQYMTENGIAYEKID